MTRKAPTILAFAFVLITLFRVAHFADVHMQAGLLGWLFAICMGASVFVVSGNTREHITIKDNAKEDRRSHNARRIAWAVLVPVIVAEGLFNLADVLSAMDANAPLHIVIAGWVYGLFPTLLVAGLGILQGSIDRLPIKPQRSILSALYTYYIRKIESMTLDEGVKNVKSHEKTNKIDAMNTAKAAKKQAQLERLAVILRDNPTLGDTEIAERMGVTRQTVHSWRKQPAAIQVNGYNKG